MPANKPPHSRAIPANQTSPVAQFESALQQLEQLVENMERGEMSLEESLTAYERGVGLYRNCQKALEQAELRVRLLEDPEHPERAKGFPPLSEPPPDSDNAT